MRTCLIPLSQGQSAIVDEVDYDWAMQWKWSTLNVKGAFYAVRRLAGTNKTILLHRDFSMPVKPDKFMPKTVANPWWWDARCHPHTGWQMAGDMPHEP